MKSIVRLFPFVAFVFCIPLEDLSAADWPRPTGPISTISMGVQAHFVSDDDGSRRTRRGTGEEAAADVATWVDKMNSIYSVANLHFDFDSSANSSDWGDVQNTLINSLSGSGSDWGAQKAAANLKASETPERMSFFFRWGTGSGRTGGGFSWSDYDFVAMPEFNSTGLCGHQNKVLLAHEAGHYLGLAHTFARGFDSVDDAEAYYISHGRDPSVFDGDGREDTPPDPYSGGTACNQSITSLTLDGDEFPLPRRNVMSYYDSDEHPEGGTLSSSQAWTVRSSVLMRTGQSLTNLVSGNAEEPQEGEGFNKQVTSGSFFNQGMGSFHGKWSDNSQMFWKNGGVGDELSFNFNAPSDGLFNVYASFTAAKDYGIFDHVINGQTSSSSIDLYSTSVIPTGLVDLGVFDLSAGSNEWIAEITGSNPNANSGNGYGLDFLMLAPALLSGDLNTDGQVNQADIDAFVLGWQKVLTTDDDATAWAKGDLNLDRVSDLRDAFLLREALKEVDLSFDFNSLNAVPEPSTFVLLAMVVFGLGFVRRVA